MRISNKPNIAAGSVLLLVAAFFSISLALLPLDFGAFGPGQDTLLYTVCYTLGDMLFSVYGYSSILIPVFLFVAGLSCFAKKWTAKQSMRLLTAIVPFFTAVIVEKICRTMAEDFTDDLAFIKIILTALIGVMLMVIEIIGAGLIADRVNDFLFHKEKYADNKSSDFDFSSEVEREPVSTAEVNLATEPTVDQSAPTVEQTLGVSSEATVSPVAAENSPAAAAAASSATTVAETPAVQEEDPFAHVFDEENANSGSMLTQEEYAALNGISQDSETAEEPEEQLDWPDTDQIKAQAGAVDEEESEDSEEDDESEDPEDFDPFDFGNPDFEESEPENNSDSDETDDNSTKENVMTSEENVISTDDDVISSNVEKSLPQTSSQETAYSETQDSYEEESTPEDDLDAAFDEFEKYNEQVKAENAQANTLDPDFFDIDMNSDEEPVIEDDDNIQDSAVQDSEPENPTISFGSDVFADMENDARKQLEENQDDTFFDGNDTASQNENVETEEPEAEEYSDGEDNIQEESEASEDSEEPVPAVSEQLDTTETEAEISEDDTRRQREDLASFFAENSDSEEASEAEQDVEDEITLPVPEQPAAASKPAFEVSEAPVRTTVKTEPKQEGHRVQPKKPYIVPTDLLEEYGEDQYWIIDEQTKEDAIKLKTTLTDFDISAEVIGIKKGPVVTMFEIAPAPGVRLSKIVGLQDNIALSLAASSVRIVAPIPGKAAVGIEVPNRKRSIVSFREMIEQDLPEFNKMAVPVILGKDILGKSQLIDIAKTPHLLIAGATGAGKSVCVNSIILSILYKRSPQQVKMILVDPKVVELKLYNDIPHLLTPVITEPKKALQALQWCLCEMERRYALLDQLGVRDISNYNKRIDERKICTEKLPYIVIIIDEFADLMATSGKELESNVARLAAMSRAVGIHLVLATQRPSVNVITGLIKANIPSRIAFMVSSRTDSNIIIDSVGAEKLLGKGDMLYASAVDPNPIRIQGTFESDNDVEKVVEYVKTLGEPDYIDDQIFIEEEEEENGGGSGLFNDGCNDPLYEQALDIVIQSGKASASYLQRRLSIGYNRAARLVEEMEDRGIVGPANGSKPREIIHVPD